MRNRISSQSLTQKRILAKWGHSDHHRVANYMKLYSQVINVSKFVLVSHRNMISVYDMSKDIVPKKKPTSTDGVGE